MHTSDILMYILGGWTGVSLAVAGVKFMERPVTFCAIALPILILAMLIKFFAKKEAWVEYENLRD